MEFTIRKLLLDTLHIVPYKPGDTAVSSDRDIAAAVTVNENLHALGLSLTPEGIFRLAASPSLDTLYVEVKELVPAMKAAPMYPDFPKQVMKMPEAKYRFHQLMHYFSTYGLELLFGVQVDKGWLPDVKHTRKTKTDARLLPYTFVELIPEEEAFGTAIRRILTRQEKMTLPEKQLVLSCLPRVSKEDLAFTIPYKENLELLFVDVLNTLPREDAITALSGLCQHTGDVLKNIHILLKAQKYHLRTSQKRTLVKLLECYSVPDFRGNLILSRKRRESNLTVLKHLDFNKYARSSAHIEAVAALRDDLLTSWEGQAKKLLLEHADNALSFAGKRPGYMVRMLGWLLAMGYSEEELTDTLISGNSRYNARTLIRLISTFRTESEEELLSRQETEMRELSEQYDRKRRSLDRENIYELHCYNLRRAEAIRDDGLFLLELDTKRRLYALEESTLSREKQNELETLYDSLKTASEYMIQSYKRETEQIKEQLANLQEQIQVLSRVLRGLETAGSSDSEQLHPGDYQWLAHWQAAYIRKNLSALKHKASGTEKLLRRKQLATGILSVNIRAALYTEEYLDEIHEVELKYQDLQEKAVPMRNAILDEAEKEKEKICNNCEETCKRLEAAFKKKAQESLLAKSLQRLEQEEAAEAERVRMKYAERIQRLGTLPARRRILERLLEQHVKNISTPLKGKKVFLDAGRFDLAHSVLEGNCKSMDGTYIPSGIAYKIPDDASSVRLYVYWNDHHRVDVDLHASGMIVHPADQSGKVKTEHVHIGWNAGYNEHGITHSGDITHSDAAEYIDIDLDTDVSYVFLNVDLYSGKQNLSQIDECFVGMMAVQEFGEDVKLYSAANSFFTHNIYQKTRGLYYGYVDVKNRYVRFVGKPNLSAYDSEAKIDDPSKVLSLKAYLDMLLRGQGVVLTDVKEEADVILTMDKTGEDKAISLVDADFFLDAV